MHSSPAPPGLWHQLPCFACQSLSSLEFRTKIKLDGRVRVSNGPHGGRAPPVWHGCCNIFKAAVRQDCVPFHAPCNMLFFKCYLQQGGAASGGIWGQLKSAGIIYHPVSPPSKLNPSLLETQRAESRRMVEPFLTFISLRICLHNPLLIGVCAFLLQLLTHQAVFVSVLWHLTNRDTCQEFAHTPAEMQISSWIDKKPTRWNAKTIWVDMPRTCLRFSSLPALQ